MSTKWLRNSENGESTDDEGGTEKRGEGEVRADEDGVGCGDEDEGAEIAYGLCVASVIIRHAIGAGADARL